MCGPCPSGYAGDGVSCIFKGVCHVNNGGCHYLAQCRDNPSRYIIFIYLFVHYSTEYKFEYNANISVIE